MMLALDHLVVAAATLPEGVEHVERLLGVEMSPGGQHVFMGTHNAVLRLGDACYLEVIAIDPSLPAPPRPRWFGLDDPALQASLAKSPRLIHWVARTDDIVTAQAMAPEILGPVLAASRGKLNWKITIPDSGALPEDCAFPTLIEWPNGDHIAGNMADRGCRLVELKVVHPEADKFRGSFRLPLHPKVRFEQERTIKLLSTILTPSGLRKLF
jgi:Glyoxalase-like domain